MIAAERILKDVLACYDACLDLISGLYFLRESRILWSWTGIDRGLRRGKIGTVEWAIGSTAVLVILSKNWGQGL